MKIAAFGDINIDAVLDVDRLPALGDEVFSTRRQELLGGSAVNTAVVLSRLGLESAVMGAVGDDDAGHRALYQLGAIGVDTDLISVSQIHPTAINTILVTPDRERTMIGARGANVTYEAASEWEKGAAWLHVSGYALLEGRQQQSALTVMETAAGEGLPVSLDVPVGVGERIRDPVSDRLSTLRIISGSGQSLSEITGSTQPARTLVERGVTLVAMTSGAEPLKLIDSDTETAVTPPRVDPVDVTGAGDALMAGLIAADMASLESGPMAVLAAAAGAAATLVSGASDTLADTETWGYLLSADRWSDAAPAWLATVSSFVDGLHSEP